MQLKVFGLTIKAVTWKKLLAHSCFIFFLILLAHNVGAQEPVYRQFTVRDGLPSDVIYSAVQDDQGFMWFGTDAGVVRYDGKNFQKFSVNDGIPDNDILKLFKDSKGRIWFLSLNGKLSFYYNGEIHNAANDPLVPKERSKGGLISAHEDKNGGLWFGGLANNIVLIRTDSTFSNFLNDSLPNSNSLLSQVNFLEPSPGVIYANAGRLMFDYNHTTLKGKRVPFFDSFSNDYRFLDLSNGKFIVVDNGRIVEGAKNRIVNETKLSNCSIDHTTRVSVDNDGSIWVMNSNKENLFYKKNKSGFDSGIQMFDGLHVSQVYPDKEGNDWVCTNGDGLLLLSYNKGIITRMKLGAGENPAIPCLYKEANGKLLVGTESGWVYRISKNEIDSVFMRSNSMRVNRVLDMVVDAKGNLFCACDRGLYVVELNSNGRFGIPKRVFGKNGEAHESFKAITIDQHGVIYTSNRVFIARVLRDSNGTFKIDDPLFYSGRTYALNFDNSNKLWFEQFERLNYIQDQVTTPLTDLDSLFLGKITDIKNSSNQQLLVATFGKGLQVLRDNKKYATIDITSGLSSNYCRRLYIKGNEWFVATTNGLNIILWDGKSVKSLVSYTESDGLLSNEILDVVAFDSLIVMATPLGLCFLDRKIEKTTDRPPGIIITTVLLNNKPVFSIDELELAKSSDKIKISFIAPEFLAPDKINYEYRLNENENWERAPINEMELTSLIPGDYIFQVRARKYNSDWSAPSEVRFRIAAPFYDTLLFKLFLGGLMVSIGFYLFRRIASQKLKKQLRQLEQQQMIEAERRRISADVHDDFGADLTQLVLLSRLAKKKTDKEEIIDKIETASLGVITKMNEIIWALNPSNDSLPHLASYLRKLSYEFSDNSGITIDFQTKGEFPEIMLSAALRRNIYLIFKESTRNIIQHASATRVMVNFQCDVDHRLLLMSIKDNGTGFNTMAKAEYGNGLQNMRKRAEEINATLIFNELIDGGTEIDLIVTIPD
ncbi:MAG: hypothetical protein RIQ47_1136 [Bacteroidota bacterium]|jgi:signal transduction histidine kinase/ligand-binding sensor domain-containing protein